MTGAEEAGGRVVGGKVGMSEREQTAIAYRALMMIVRRLDFSPCIKKSY